MDRFWTHGFETTSMADLVECTGVHRGSLYATFGNKEAIFVAALRRYGQKYGIDAMRPALESATPIAAMKQFIWDRFDDYVAGRNVCGCLVSNSLACARPEDGKVFEELSTMLGLREQLLIQAMIRGKESGELSEASNPQALGSYLNTFLLGITLQVRTRPDPESLRHSIQAGIDVIR